MTSRIGTRRTARAAAVLLGAAAVVVALAAPAFADPVPPPGWIDQPLSSAWVGFTVNDTSPAITNRSTGARASVTLTRSTSPGLDVVSSFNNWEYRDFNDGAGPVPGWPAAWSAGGVTLHRKDDWCPAANTSCAYDFVSGGGQPFFFAAASTNPDGSANVQDLGSFNRGVVSLPPPPDITINFGWDPTSPANKTPASGTTPGRLTLDASANDGLGQGTLSYEWTVTRVSDGKAYTSSPAPTASFDLDADGVYCVALKVTNSADGYTKTYGVTTQDCKLIDQVAPQAPANAPGSGGGVPAVGGGGAGGSGGGGGGVVPTVVFAKPRTVRATSLTGTGKSAGSAVIWLWRPDFYQPSSDTQTLPQTTGRPLLKGHQDIVVRSTPAPDQNAGPWLAGLGIFGVIGIGWVFNKRRQVRRAEY